MFHSKRDFFLIKSFNFEEEKYENNTFFLLQYLRNQFNEKCGIALKWVLTYFDCFIIVLSKTFLVGANRRKIANLLNRM